MSALVEPVQVHRVDRGASSLRDDLLVSEEPLEIRLGYGPLEDRRELRLSVTMRTPGHDEDLVRGFLLTEGIITGSGQLHRVAPCMSVKPEEQGNVMRAELDPEVVIESERWQRNFYTTSSCGVCGKSSIEAVHVRNAGTLVPWGTIDPAVITALPEKMKAAQTVFRHTGGIHAAGLFNREGDLLCLREDVGRHNAVDKVIGASLFDGHGASEGILLVSGRAGFELVQKCVVAGIPLMVAIGAPSSLAVQLARKHGLTLIGFLRDQRFNRYTP